MPLGCGPVPIRLMLALPSICTPPKKKASIRPCPARSKSSPPAVGHVAPGLAAEQADLRPAATAFAREQGGCARNRRRGPDRDPAEARKHAGNDLDEERSLFRAHSAAMRPAVSSVVPPVTCAAQ